jgi:NAD-dependent deacetylase
MKNIDFEFKVGMVADMIAGSTRIVVFTGAGVSTESGIPDFRSPGGIWTRFDPEEFTIDRFLGSPETRRKTWELLGGSGLITDAEPNPAHYAICELEKAGRLACVITQNIDNLHQKAGCPPEKPDVVYFGEALPREALDKATYHSRHCDLFIVIGSSLSVYPAAYMPTYALESGAKLVIINATRTFCDDQAEVVINGMAGLTMERILQDAKRKMKTGKGE